MYISQLQVKNFRCFEDEIFEFRPGLNVLIGENNAGKTTLLAALRHVLDNKSPGFTSHDIHCKIQNTDEPPRIVITLTVLVEEDEQSEDFAAISAWMTKTSSPMEAQLSVAFELPQSYHAKYRELYNKVPDATPTAKFHYAFGTLFDQGKFQTSYYGGEIANCFVATTIQRHHFGCQFLEAQRDAEAQLSSGKSWLLRRMLRHFFDRVPADETKQEDFRKQRNAIVDNVKGRLDSTSLFALATDVWGAAFKAEPGLWGHFGEQELLQWLLLKLQHTEANVFDVPLSHNGLGYNNLLYVALVLAYLGIDSAGELEGEEPNDDTPRFPVLLLEEPEAHLHPALQYRFLLFLRERLEPEKQGNRIPNRQVFLTSHSTQITSGVSLDNLICLYYCDIDKKPKAAYPGKAFAPEENDSKMYVERFLDATKSAFLFSKGILFVEGLAEQLLIPQLADLAYPHPTRQKAAWLDRNFIALVRTDGVTFKHFLPLFGFSKNATHAKYGLSSRRVACISDADPVQEDNSSGTVKKTRCYPYQNGEHSATAKLLKDFWQGLPPEAQKRLNIGLSTKTFEYDLAYHNHKSSGLLTAAINGNKRAALQAWINSTERISRIKEDWYSTSGIWSKAWKKATESFTDYLSTGVEDIELERNRFAAHYLAGCEDAKGEHAYLLSAFLAKQTSETLKINLPPYIEEGLHHVCLLEPLSNLQVQPVASILSTSIPVGPSTNAATT